jgi:hypothetical protein
MGQTASVRLGHSLQEARAVLLITLGVSVLLGVPAAPATAQQTRSEALPSQVRPGPICTVRTNDTLAPAEGNARQVTAVCGTHGLLLGYADTFQVFSNERLQAVLVDMRRGEDRTVLLISLQDERPPLLEDIGGQISMTAGRGPMGSLEGIEVDVAGFAQGGTIGLRSRSEASGEAKTDTIDLGRKIAEARAVRGAFPARN